ncbi:hypothetical protein PAXRUDRAFT_160196 [Paxillus rubicundulus Ve08.2h10]|uniref:Uncharacterized protein n=1 Tax=Paxillus rubicundulus Ve08.2h10 TaxID=930991 RepID=A0A0D0CWD8_9AGAM|nr:hypothetical protein PAXRUDRAFT_160196 [Paxillus rubicundulus Ve08.2h10]
MCFQQANIAPPAPVHHAPQQPNAASLSSLSATPQHTTLHSRSFSANKHPALLPNSPAKTLKKQRTFPSSRSAPNQSQTKAGPLPCCAVCLGRHDHCTIDCEATRTWDDIFNTFSKRIHKALFSKANVCLCTKWQCSEGCSEHHALCHICSGCGALTHSAQSCPRAQKAPSANTL